MNHYPQNRSSQISFCCLTIAIGLVSFAGCDGNPPRPPLGKKAKTVADAEIPDSPLTQSPANSITSAAEKRLVYAPAPAHQPQPIEAWYRYEMRGANVGSMHIQIDPIADTDKKLFRVKIEDTVRVRRRDDVTEQRFEQTSIETAAGALVSFDTNIRAGDDQTIINGTVALDRLKITTTTNDKTPQVRQLPWLEGYGSLLAPQQSLREKPLEQGEVRRLRLLLPVQCLIGEVELKSIGFARVPVDGDEVQRLHEIEESVSINGTTIQRTVMWMDEAGEVLKTYYPAVDMLAIRTDEAGTKKSNNQPLPDLLTLSRIGLSDSISPDAESTVFLLTHKNPEYRLQANARQQVEVLDSGVLRVTVTAEPIEDSHDESTTDEDLAASPKIEIEDAEVQRLADLAESDVDDPMKLATELRDIVHEHITKRDFSQAFASAAETAKERTGDCTEHAVLLAAVCRARKIPARIAAGLVQVQDEQGPAMNFHAWVLVWDGDHWRPLDAMFGDRKIGAERIELLSTDLADGNPYAVLAPVMEVVGQLKIDLEKP